MIYRNKKKKNYVKKKIKPTNSNDLSAAREILLYLFL